MKKLQRRPAPVLYFFAAIYFSIHNRLRYHIKCTGDKPKGPALILSNHASNHDFEYIVSVAYPNRVSFMSTYHWFTFKKLNFWLRRIGAIPKLQFATDIESIKKVRYVVQHEKGIVFIAPEGTVYANGKLGNIHPSIAKMIKFLKVPVYATRIEGAGLGNSKWNAKPHKGYIHCDTKKILTQEETQSLKPEEIMARVVGQLSYNEFDYQERNNVKLIANDLAEGFNTMYYKCPHCGSEFTIESKGNDIECTCCHTKATMLETQRFRWNTEKQYFDNYIEWYDWQYEKIKEEISKPNFELTDEVDYGIDKPGIDNYVKVGHGKMTLNHGGWTYTGTFEDSEVIEHDELREVPLATLKVGLHFELPYKNGHCRVFYPKNGLTSMKWHLASRAFTELSQC